MQRVALMSFALTIGVAAWAQSPCPTQVLQGSSAKSSSDLLCMIPQQYGAGGLVGSDNGGPLNSTINKGHEAHFQASSVSDFRPINAEIGLQLSQVPLAAPVAGVTFQNGVWQEAVGLGPVLADRAETIGRHAVFLGFNYEYFDFDKADIKPGNSLTLGAIPVGTTIHNVELRPGKGAQVARGAGVAAGYRLAAEDVLALGCGRRVDRMRIGVVDQHIEAMKIAQCHLHL